MNWINGHWKSSQSLGTSGQTQTKKFGNLKNFWETKVLNFIVLILENFILAVRYCNFLTTCQT